MTANQLVGKEINDYILGERIGRGATADVYRARQKSVKREVALKVINPLYNIDDQQDFRQRFEREAKIIATLEHVHILPVHDYGVTTDGLAYIVMRLMRGGSLDELIAKAPLPLERAVALFGQIASALHYAHEHGIIHRDIKPSNILLDDLGNAYISDFGVAKFTGHPSLSLTKSGYIIGAPAYSSPEQLRDQPIDRRSDVFALGVLLYTMLVGHTPFAKTATGILEVIDKQIYEQPPSPRSLRPDISPEVEAVIMMALNKNPSDRFPTAQAFGDALTAAINGELATGVLPSIVSSPTRSAPPALPSSSNSDGSLRRLYAFGIVAVIVAIAVVIVLSQVIGRVGFNAAPTPIIRADERGSQADVVPSSAEIHTAQKWVGADHFVAYITCTLDSQIQAARARLLNDDFQAYGIDFRVYDPAMDRVRQVNLIMQAIDEGARGLIICPLDDSTVREGAQRAEREHIPVVFTAPVSEGYGAVMIEPDNHFMGLQVGRAAGEYIAETLDGEAAVIVIGYSQLQASRTRMDAMGSALLEVAPRARIIRTYEAGVSRDSGYAAARRAIEEGIVFDVILSLSDATSFGIISALEEAGVARDAVAVFSVNAEPAALELIRDGRYMRGTLQVASEDIAHLSANALVRLLASATLPEYIVLPQGTMLTAEVLEARP